MKYGQYITKKRTRLEGISGRVNIPYGTILPAAGDYIMHQGKILCAVTSRNAKEYFWGYDPEHPEEEIRRQQAVERLMNTAPQDPGNMDDPLNPWRKYGHIEQTPVGDMWAWESAVEDLPESMAEYLLACAMNGSRPAEVPA